MCRNARIKAEEWLYKVEKPADIRMGLCEAIKE